MVDAGFFEVDDGLQLILVERRTVGGVDGVVGDDLDARFGEQRQKLLVIDPPAQLGFDLRRRWNRQPGQSVFPPEF